MVGQQLTQSGLDLGGLIDALFAHALPQGCQQLVGRLHACVGHDQRRLQLFEQILVYDDIDKDVADALTRARQALLQA